MMSIQDAPCITPCLDSWSHRDHAATWMWTPRSRPSSDQADVLNAWTVGQIEALLRAFGPWARLRSAWLTSPAKLPQASAQYVWGTTASSDQAGFVREVLTALATSAAPVTSVELTLDLFVWVRTQPNLPPEQGWILGLARVDLQSETESPYGALMMNHTLFRDGQTLVRSNAELHRLNQPLLAAALTEIESSLGLIDSVEGLPDVYGGGFRSLSPPPSSA